MGGWVEDELHRGGTLTEYGLFVRGIADPADILAGRAVSFPVYTRDGDRVIRDTGWSQFPRVAQRGRGSCHMDVEAKVLAVLLAADRCLSFQEICEHAGLSHKAAYGALCRLCMSCPALLEPCEAEDNLFGIDKVALRKTGWVPSRVRDWDPVKE